MLRLSTHAHQKSRFQLLLSCAFILLAMVAVCTSSSGELRRRQAIAQSSVVRGETLVQKFSEGGEFNFTRLYYFVYYAFSLKSVPSTFVFDEATELMHSLTQLPTNTSFVEVIEEILLGALSIDFEFIVDHQDVVNQLLQKARVALLSVQLPKDSGSVLVGSDMQIAVLKIDESMREIDVTLCSPRNKASPFEEIVHSKYDTKSPLEKCYFALTVSNGTLRNARIAVLVFPLNQIIKPLPLKEYPIYNSRVMDIVLVPSSRHESSGEQLLTIFFEPSLNVNTTKGCSYWNKTLSSWTTEGCWVDHEICYCNLSTHLDVDPTGGQYIVYEHSDVLFNTSSYDYLMEHERDVSADYFIAEASALVHNISFLPGSRVERFRLSELVAKTLRVSSQLPEKLRTEATTKHIKRFYKNSRNVFKSFKRLPSWEIGNNVLIISRKIENSIDSGMSFALQNNFNVKYHNHSQINSLNAIQNAQVTYALTASRSVAEQNEQVAYMLFPMDKFFFRPIKKVGNLQVHNFRVVDISLVPRPWIRSKKHQFIDIWYQPSVSNAFAKDVRLGCAYWSNNDSVWTTEGCVVHPNSAYRGCRCNLSAHFNDAREGGQYVVFESSDVILDYERIENIEPSIGMSFEEDLYLIEELVTFLHNLTQIGYLSTDALQYATVIALRVLGFNQPVLKLARHFLVPMVNDLHYMVYRWASDDNAVYSNLFGTYYNGSITTPFAISLEANDVLSNEVLRTKSSLLHQTVYFVTRLGLALSNIGVKVTSDKTEYLRVPPSTVLSSKQQLSYYFSTHSADKVRITVVMYPNSKSYLPLYSLPAIFSCHFLDVTIISEENDGDLPPASSRVITLVYVSGEPRSTGVSTACSVWTDVGWSAKTCWQESDNAHACSCNLSAHALSNGSFLPVLIYESPLEKNFSPKASFVALDVIYVVFSVASLIGLALIALIGVVFAQWRDDVGHKILLHMSLALFLYQTLRLFRETHHVYTTMNRDVKGFVAFTAVTHYSRLAHYSWMLTMAWLQLRRLLTVVGAADIPHLLMKVSVVAWGVPLIPLVVLLSWNREEHFAQPDKATHLVLYLVPGAVVTIVNVIILAIILARLFSCCGWGKMEDLARHGISGGKLTRRRLATAVLLVFLFGLPTVFEMVNDFWGHSLVLEVLFKVFDPVRGAIVFVYFVLLDRKTFEMWREKVRSLVSSNATQETEMF